MNFSDDFLNNAQAQLMGVIRAKLPELNAAYGTVEEEIKEDSTPVTVLDKELETDIRKKLLAIDSRIGIEGEEFGKEGSDETFWLVDPIDGTENFIRGLPFVRSMITLIDNGQPVYALVYRPFTDELFTARAGKGAFCNGQRLTISQRPLSRVWVELSAPVSQTEVTAVLQPLQKIINGFRTTGEFTYVAQGKIDAHLIYKAHGQTWDYAPRALLIAEAGGTVRNVGSDSFDYRNGDILAASPTIFDELMAAIVSGIA